MKPRPARSTTKAGALAHPAMRTAGLIVASHRPPTVGPSHTATAGPTFARSSIGCPRDHVGQPHVRADAATSAPICLHETVSKPFGAFRGLSRAPSRDAEIPPTVAPYRLFPLSRLHRKLQTVLAVGQAQAIRAVAARVPRAIPHAWQLTARVQFPGRVHWGVASCRHERHC